jgi:HD-GYP domain-containing protein (c-di-GMP phosphodiesterase class II)
MTSDRAYRKAMTPKAAMDELKHCIGKYYDKDVVLAFEQVLHEEGVL